MTAASVATTGKDRATVMLLSLKTVKGEGLAYLTCLAAVPTDQYRCLTPRSHL